MHITENAQYLTSIKKLHKAFPYWETLAGRTISLSGASGMFGSYLVDLLMLRNKEVLAKKRTHIICFVHNFEKAKKRFMPWFDSEEFTCIRHDICQPLPELTIQPDYWIHAASPADPVNMAKYPVDTLLANVLGTKNLLEYGLSHGMKRLLFVSSGEVYGQPSEKQDDFTEDYCGPLDLSNPRSCYPEGKRAAEVLCQSYASQMGADVVIARPCHLFGPTMSQEDSRAVAEFLWAAAAGRKIVLKGDGMKERSHCHVADAVYGVLMVLVKGVSGEAYNIADKQYQMTIREFAEHSARVGSCKVVFEQPNDIERKGYSKISKQVLDAGKLEKLGWKPLYSMRDGIEETVRILRNLRE